MVELWRWKISAGLQVRQNVAENGQGSAVLVSRSVRSCLAFSSSAWGEASPYPPGYLANDTKQ
jgi:hypothetical protein